MNRLLVWLIVFLGSSAIGLVVAAIVLEDVDVELRGFVTAVVVFSIVQAVVPLLLRDIAARKAQFLLSLMGLVSTFLALLVAHVFSGGFSIGGGAVNWILATVIVWLATTAATYLLPKALARGGENPKDDTPN